MSERPPIPFDPAAPAPTPRGDFAGVCIGCGLTPELAEQIGAQFINVAREIRRRTLGVGHA